jgi:hypothetical protein
MAMKTTVFSDVTPCSLVDRCRHFGGTCFLHLQSRQWWQRVPPVETARSSETSQNIITLWFLIVLDLGRLFSLYPYGKGGGGIKVKYLKPLLSSLGVFGFDSSTEIFSVPFAEWAGYCKPGLVFETIPFRISATSLGILNFSVSLGKCSYTT